MCCGPVIICAIGSHITLRFPAPPKGDAGAHLLLVGFFARDDYGENTGTGISTWAITFFFPPSKCDV